jgi:hypothetical protein
MASERNGERVVPIFTDRGAPKALAEIDLCMIETERIHLDDTWLGSGFGSGRSSIAKTSGPPYCLMTIACMIAAPCFC